jgi:ABC-type lipoprotein release transport system permease subunit
VRAVVAPDDLTADAGWTPPIEGLSDRATCSEWDPGLPVDLSQIDPRDEAWWSEYGPAPKAYVSLAAGQRIWGNPHGRVTSVRYPPGTEVADVAKGFLLRVRPEDVGVRVRDVGQQLSATAVPANDFGALFLGFQFVLLVSALWLTALLFSFTLERRGGELGALRATGWSRGAVRALFLTEGIIVAAAGVVLGLPLAAAVAWGLLQGVSGVWATAVGGVELPFVFVGRTVAAGAIGSLFAAMVALRWTSRVLLAQAPRTLLTRRGTWGSEVLATSWHRPAAFVSLAAGLVLALVTEPARTPAAAGTFFGAGALVLLAGGLWAQASLARSRGSDADSLWALALGGARRRPRRSLSLVWMLASGTFLVVGVGMGAGQAAPDGHDPAGGSGGYPWFGTATLPVPATPDDPDAPQLPGAGRHMEGVEVVGLRMVEGDDASCLQLGSAQTPHLLGVDPAAFAAREAFTFTSGAAGWEVLSQPRDDGRIPAIGDVGTVTWGLHRSVGDMLTFTDEHGDDMEVVIVAVVGNSVFQGGLLIPEQALLTHFPSNPGFRMFLFDVPEASSAFVPALERDLADHGLDIVPSEVRLEQFADVEHTYVAIFHALGGLGLLLGAVGVGLSLARSVEERAGEIALLSAVGYPPRRVQGLLVLEHLGLVAQGLLWGSLAAVVAVIPVLASSHADPPWLLSLVIVLSTGVVAALTLTVASGWVLARLPIRVLVRET